MKNTFQLLANILLWYFYVMVDFVMILWYNKLPKVSSYHRLDDLYSIKETYNDPDIHSKYDVNTRTSEIKDHMFEAIKNCPELCELNVHIRDNKGKSYGTQTVESYLSEYISDKLKN